MLDQTIQARNRQRRSRRRRKAGRVLLRVETDEFRLIDALIASGRLSSDDGLARARVEKAVGQLVEDRITRWLSRVAFPTRVVACSVPPYAWTLARS
jgi:hypothetical protein